MKTAIRKSINQELAEKLLLKDATLWQMTKQYYRNHKQGCELLLCAVLSLGIGYILGVSL